MKIIEKIKKIIIKAFSSGWSAEKLTQSFCIGIFIAFSPFPGAHTIMMLIAKWLFRLNFPILFIATSFNNPWTMIPFYSSDYVFGYWLLHKVFNWDPGWYIPLAKIFGSGKICILSFLIGGNILGIVSSILCYPFIKMLFKKFAIKFKPAKKFVEPIQEVNEQDETTINKAGETDKQIGI